MCTFKKQTISVSFATIKQIIIASGIQKRSQTGSFYNVFDHSRRNHYFTAFESKLQPEWNLSTYRVLIEANSTTTGWLASPITGWLIDWLVGQFWLSSTREQRLCLQRDLIWYDLYIWSRKQRQIGAILRISLPLPQRLPQLRRQSRMWILLHLKSVCRIDGELRRTCSYLHIGQNQLCMMGGTVLNKKI